MFKLDLAGVLTLVAGNSRPGLSGDDGGPASVTINNDPGARVQDTKLQLDPCAYSAFVLSE